MGKSLERLHPIMGDLENLRKIEADAVEKAFSEAEKLNLIGKTKPKEEE